MAEEDLGLHVSQSFRAEAVALSNGAKEQQTSTHAKLSLPQSYYHLNQAQAESAAEEAGQQDQRE